MIVLDFLGVLAFLYSFGYLLYFLLKKIRKKEGLFSKKLFFSTLLGSYILLAISLQFDTVSGNEYNKQVKLNKELQLQVETLNGELASLKDEIAQVSKESQTIKENESQTIEKFETDKKVLQEEQSTLKAQIVTLQKENEDLSTKLASAQKVSQTTASSNQNSANQTQSASPASTSQNVYYKNCTQVRSAGAAPIQTGDPGYARHLDRDGDGIGCE